MKTRKPKTQKQLDASARGRERRKSNLLNKASPKEVVEEVEEEPKAEHKVKSRGITKKPRKKQTIIIETSSEDESSSSEDEIIVKRRSRKKVTKAKKEVRHSSPTIEASKEEPHSLDSYWSLSLGIQRLTRDGRSPFGCTDDLAYSC